MKHQFIKMKFACGENEIDQAGKFFGIAKANREHYRQLIQAIMEAGKRELAKGQIQADAV